MNLKDLYRDVIVDHNRSPRNFREIEPPRRVADGHNPLCGDKLRVYLRVVDDRIEDVSFEGSGCAISVASASLMTETLKGKSEAEAIELFERMHDYPTRVKCASLCWHTMKTALTGGGMITTE
jgi:nitrogen fixation NifU-like protein